VGEALTKDKKSSAAARDGFVDMARAHEGWMKANETDADGLGCSRVNRNGPAIDMYWAGGLQDGRSGVGFGGEAVAGISGGANASG
jgi:hypothetical protein